MAYISPAHQSPNPVLKVEPATVPGKALQTQSPDFLSHWLSSDGAMKII